MNVSYNHIALFKETKIFNKRVVPPKGVLVENMVWQMQYYSQKLDSSKIFLNSAKSMKEGRESTNLTKGSV